MSQETRSESEKILDRALGADAAPSLPPAPPAFDIEETLRLVLKPGTPKIGLMAADGMQRCYETTASEIENIAQEGVDRALAFQQESAALARMIREAGAGFCARIEAEATRAYRMAEILSGTNEVLWRATDAAAGRTSPVIVQAVPAQIAAEPHRDDERLPADQT